MRFHRLFVLAAYGSLAIVLIAVLCPTAKGQSQHLASTRPWVGIAGTTFLTRSLIQTSVRQPTPQTGLVDYAPQTRILFSLGWLSSGLEADCGEESREIVGDSLIEAVQLTAFVRGEVTIAGKGLEETGGERCIDAFEELEKEHADGIALVGEAVATRVGKFLDQTFGSQFGKIITQRRQRVLGLGKSQSVQGGRIKVGSRKGAARGDVGEAYQSVHHRQLARMVEFKAGNPLSTGKTVGSASFRSWPRSTKVSRMSCWASW